MPNQVERCPAISQEAKGPALFPVFDHPEVPDELRDALVRDLLALSAQEASA